VPTQQIVNSDLRVTWE